MSNDQSVFSFDLNESLYFERGQEVGEIMGISLEPEISIQPFNEYISIRGVVELQGSYLKAENNNESQEEPYFSETYQAKRYMERVVDTDENSAEFVHRFPVEISVPTYRVEDLNDVTVIITSFDYELPDPSQLRLESTIEIHGINDQVEDARQEELDEVNQFQESFAEDPVEQQSFEEPAEEQIYGEHFKEQERYESVTKEDEVEESFEFEVKQKKEELVNDERLEEEELTNTPTVATNVNTNDEESEKDRWKYKESKTFAEFFKKEQPEPSPESSELEALESSASPPDYMDVDESSGSYSSSDRSEDASELRYLSDMFRSEEDKYTKMRLCIVQEEDTLESIAERYDTTSLQIVSQNRLENDHVTKGQLIYIPYKKQE